MNRTLSCPTGFCLFVPFVALSLGTGLATAQTKNACESACVAPKVVQPAQPHPLPVLAASSAEQSQLWSQIPGLQAEDTAQAAAIRNRRVSIIPGSRIQSSPATEAVQVPLADDTERAIEEVRQRLGTVGGSFSDLLSPAEQGKLFAEALAKVRQEKAAGQAPVPGQPGIPQPHVVGPGNPPQPAVPFGPQPPNSPQPGPHPQGPHSQGPHSQGPHSQGPHSQGPHSQGPHSQGPHSQGPQVGLPHQGAGNLHWAPGQPLPTAIPLSFPHPAPSNPGAGAWPMHQPGPGMPTAGESQNAAMRRIAREVDRLAEQLEEIGRYSEADSLRRQAQQLRESVR